MKFCYLLISLLFFFSSVFGNEDPLEQAHQFYQQGMQASLLADRQAAFNQALVIYLGLEKQYPSPHNGNLFKAIGNTFFQLYQYPEAILYYYRALQLSPRDEGILSQLQLAQIQLDLPTSSPDSSLQNFLSLNGWWSLSLRFSVLFWLLLLTFCAFSIFLWNRRPIFKKIAGSFLLLSTSMVINLALSYYLIPLEGVLIASTGIYREPDFQHSQVQSDPLQKGEKITILSQSKGWLKIQYRDKIVGYIPVQNARLI